MKLITVISLCTLYSFVFGDSGDLEESGHLGDSGERLADDELDVKRYKDELAAGEPSEFAGRHHHEPRYYTDLSRRFVPAYPYHDNKESKEVKLQKDDSEEDLQHVKSLKKNKNNKVKEVIPIRAPPEVVLAVMNKAALQALAQPSDPTEEVSRSSMLRSGDYWDSVWKEEVSPDNILRTNELDKETDEEEVMEKMKKSVPISAKLLPGSKLYDLISGNVKKAPRLVYIINNE